LTRELRANSGNSWAHLIPREPVALKILLAMFASVRTVR